MRVARVSTAHPFVVPQSNVSVPSVRLRRWHFTTCRNWVQYTSSRYHHSRASVSAYFSSYTTGQETIDPGIILHGESGDVGLSTRQAWQKDGSFLVFRQLKQLVPEFNKFMKDNAPVVPGLTRQEQVDLFGARMVGRWKSVSDQLFSLQI